MDGEELKKRLDEEAEKLEGLYRCYLEGFIEATPAQRLLNAGRAFSAETIELKKLVAYSIGVHDALSPARDCEVCSPTSSSRRLCARCTADPANSEWVEGRELLSRPEKRGDPTRPGAGDAPMLESDSIDFIEYAATLSRHADVIDRPLRQVTPRQRQILELALKGETVRRQRWVRRGRRRVRCGTYEVRRPLSLRAIGRATQCSHQYVAKVIRRQLED